MWDGIQYYIHGSLSAEQLQVACQSSQSHEHYTTHWGRKATKLLAPCQLEFEQLITQNNVHKMEKGKTRPAGCKIILFTSLLD